AHEHRHNLRVRDRRAERGVLDQVEVLAGDRRDVHRDGLRGHPPAGDGALRQPKARRGGRPAPPHHHDAPPPHPPRAAPRGGPGRNRPRSRGPATTPPRSSTPRTRASPTLAAATAATKAASGSAAQSTKPKTQVGKSRPVRACRLWAQRATTHCTTNSGTVA